GAYVRDGRTAVGARNAVGTRHGSSAVMRSLLAIAVFALAFIGCTNNSTNGSTPPPGPGPGQNQSETPTHPAEPGQGQNGSEGPVETRPPNAPDQKPAFPGQTRAPKKTANVKFDTQVVASGLEHPWSLAFLPDGRMLVTEKPGRMRIVSADGPVYD